MDACRFWERGIDPFGCIKMAELDSGAAFAPVIAIAAANQARDQDATSQVVAAMHASIWGNRSDLSFSAGGALDRSAGDSWFLTDIPNRIRATFSGARMVVVKGDFNYRRAMRDTIWPTGVSAAEAMGPVGDLPPILFLRTMKSDVIAGVTEPVVASLESTDRDWRINGSRGVIQLVG